MGNQQTITANYSFIKMEQKKGLPSLRLDTVFPSPFLFCPTCCFLILKSKFLQTQRFLLEVGAAPQSESLP